MLRWKLKKRMVAIHSYAHTEKCKDEGKIISLTCSVIHAYKALAVFNFRGNRIIVAEI